jgi:exonuclease III
LENKNIFSSYHLFHKKIQGKETHPTLYMYRHQDKPYHIDYCFASADLIKKLTSVEVGAHSNWSKHSDHTPLIVTFDI